FVATEHLLDDQIDLAGVRRQAVRRRLPQLAEGAGRIEQAIRMLKADAGARASFDEREQQLVRRREHARVFDADAGEVVDVEEAPIVDFVERRTPEREAVRLS